MTQECMWIVGFKGKAQDLVVYKNQLSLYACLSQIIVK